MKLKREDAVYYVQNLDAAIAFYEQKLGFKLKFKEDWGFALIEVSEDDYIGLMTVANYQKEFPEHADDLRPRTVFRAEDLDYEVERLKSNGVRVSNVFGESGGPRSALFWDLDNNPYYMYSLPD